VDHHNEICFHKAKIRPSADLIEGFRNSRFGHCEFVESSSQGRMLVESIGAPGDPVGIRWRANLGDVTFDFP
jgi:hypothetical protein